MKFIKSMQPFIDDILLIIGMIFISTAIYRININAGLIATGVFLFSLAGLLGVDRQTKEKGGD
ncbi:DUF1056 family protein [Bacillus changyiensis]|uniref:DUF1056 family protein n=1 Tax=Bacillus changyiensis TaxID=3004103 RepID=UPI0022E3AE05|nr:DUF1056 family protein [Bacillus changyiensis]MDA1478284.1 DUF1056 family protein [Bacillus changyiensis]